MYSLEPALKEQIMNCHAFPRFRCGVYIKSPEKRKRVADELRKLLERDIRVEKFINSSDRTEVYFENESSLRVICANDNARGQRHNGVIVDGKISCEILRCIILPSIIPRVIIEPTFEPYPYVRETWAEMQSRILYCDIG